MTHRRLAALALLAALMVLLQGTAASAAILGNASHRRSDKPRASHVRPKRGAGRVCRGRRLVHVTLTTANLTRALRSMPDLALCRSAPRYTARIVVSDSIRYQRVEGFGGAMTDSSAWLLQTQLSPLTRTVVMSRLFGKGGIGLNFIRVPMGASDFSAIGIPYTYDDVPAGQTDPTLTHFSVGHDEAYLIPALKLALANNPAVRLLANPWSPPAWMKSNDRLDNLNDTGAVLPDAYPALAQYFVRFLQAYAADGVPVTAITLQNEPGVMTEYPGALLSPTDESALLSQYLAPALRDAGLSPRIYGDDLNWDNTVYPTTLATGAAASSLAGISWHCYQGDPDEMGAFHAQFPGLDEIVSECSPEILGFSTIELLVSSLRNYATTVAVWNVALDPSGGPVQAPNSGCFGCTGLVTVSEATHTVRYSLKYFQLGQVSKFVEPGAVRIASTSAVTYDPLTLTGRFRPSPGVDNAAFLNPDGSKALVAANTSRVRQRFTVSWRARTFAYTLPAGATVTFTWR